MTKIKITTTQNIDIEYELATVFDRILAWLVDFLLIVAYIGLAIALTGILFEDPSSYAYGFMVTPIALYHLVSEWLLNGRSVGKMAVGIKVVRLNGSPANLGNYFVRWFMRGIETFPIFFFGAIGVTSSMLNPRGQRIGDIMAGTTVIKTGKAVSMSETIYSKTKADYEPFFPMSVDLNDRDINTLREVLRLYRMERNAKLLNVAANRVAHVLKIIPPSNMGAERFIRTIIRDYNHLS